jgi:hypothetical protein
MAWAASPVLANCPFQLPLVQGGDSGSPAGFILSAGPDVNGAFWELGFGDPADGVGNDSNSLISGFPAFTSPTPDFRWIKLDAASNNYKVNYNWFNNGVDGCISGGSGTIVTTVMVYYIVETGGNYAIAALQGTADFGPAQNNLDLLVTGVGPNNNDVPLAPKSVAPQLANVTINDDTTITADVLPAAAGVNIFYDAGGPYAGVIDTKDLTLDQVPSCDPLAGCNGVTLNRDANVCWTGDVVAIASEAAGAAVCVGGVLDGYACDPNNPADACLAFTGTCPPGPSVVTPFGPPIPGGCTAIGGPLVSDTAVFHATKSKGFTVFTWNATEFAVSHYNIIDVTRGERQVNEQPIARLSNNDGTPTSYEFVASGKDIRGGKTFELEMVRTDGQTVRFPVE